MKIVPVLSLVLLATTGRAATFEARTRYDLSGTWNEGRQQVTAYSTDPLGRGVTKIETNGEQLVEEIWVYFSITFPEAPRGATNIFSSAYIEFFDGQARHERTLAVTPIVEDCGGTLCKYEEMTFLGSTGPAFSLLPYDLLVGSPNLAGTTHAVSVLVSPPSFQAFTHTGYNSRTLETLGPVSPQHLRTSPHHLGDG